MIISILNNPISVIRGTDPAVLEDFVRLRRISYTLNALNPDGLNAGLSEERIASLLASFQHIVSKIVGDLPEKLREATLDRISSISLYGLHCPDHTFVATTHTTHTHHDEVGVLRGVVVNTAKIFKANHESSMEYASHILAHETGHLIADPAFFASHTLSESVANRIATTYAPTNHNRLTLPSWDRNAFAGSTGLSVPDFMKANVQQSHSYQEAFNLLTSQSLIEASMNRIWLAAQDLMTEVKNNSRVPSSETARARLHRHGVSTDTSACQKLLFAPLHLGQHEMLCPNSDKQSVSIYRFTTESTGVTDGERRSLELLNLKGTGIPYPLPRIQSSPPTGPQSLTLTDVELFLKRNRVIPNTAVLQSLVLDTGIFTGTLTRKGFTNIQRKSA